MQEERLQCCFPCTTIARASSLGSCDELAYGLGTVGYLQLSDQDGVRFHLTKKIAKSVRRCRRL